ncbi:hypothetical protein Tco_0322063 [Tanacetum coccineum]
MIMETIHVKFDELTAMASEHDCLEPELQNYFNNHNSYQQNNEYFLSKEYLDTFVQPNVMKKYFEHKLMIQSEDSANFDVFDAENIVVGNKTRLVAKGYKQEEGIAFEESFALVASLRPLPDDPDCVELIEPYSDAEHAGCKDDCKSTSGGLQFLEHVEKGTMEIYFIGTEYQLADLFTKALPKECFKYLVHHIVIIMAQQQHAADVHPDELCPPNKRYDLMDANKKVELEHVQCPSESKILMNIIKNHPLRFSIAASASVPWIYMAQFWHTLKEDGSKHRLKFLLDRKELTLDDFRTIFHLPQANDNNHASFVLPPSFSDMVPFYKQVLGFTMELKTVSNFKISGLLQPWQTLCKIFSKCLTTRVTGWDQPPLQIMQMLYCFVNNIHVDYAELMWEGIYYSLHHPATSIPYPRFTKIIISHYMTIFPDISRRARDAYHNLQDDDIMKNIFNSGRNKNKVGMRIPAWMITDEMKLTEHYKMTPSTPRSPNPATETAESSVPKRSTVIRFRLPSRKSARLTPPAPVPSTEKADEMILQDIIQVSLAEHKSREEQEARENVALDDMVTYLHSRKCSCHGISDLLADNLHDVMMQTLPSLVKEKVTEQVKKEVPAQVRDQVHVYLAKGLILERKTTKEETEILISKAILKERGGMQAQISSQIQNAIDNAIPSLVDASMKFEKIQVTQSACRFSAVRIIDQDDPHDDAHHEGENSAKRQKTLKYEALCIWESIFRWTVSIPTKQVTQDVMEEISLIIDEAKLKKMADEMLRQRCTAGKMTSLEKGIQVLRSRLSPSVKFLAIVFNDDDIEERTSRWASDYKNLNKNDIEDMYLLIMNNKVPNYANTGLLWSLSVFIRSSVIWERVHDFQLGIKSYQQKINLTAPTITFPGIEEYDVFSIVYEPVHGIIYTNSKKEKRVMRPSEIHKFCDATLRRTLEGLKSYYNDVKYCYVQKELTNDEFEFLKLFEEEFEVRLIIKIK